MTLLLSAPRSPVLLPRLKTSARGPVLTGIGVIGLFFGGFGAWAALSPLSSAAIAPGVVAVESNRKTVQHLEGGIIEQILVDEGEQVQAGQVLLRLDRTRSQATYDVLLGQYRAVLALENRLTAERDGLAIIAFADELTSAASNPDVAKILVGQTRLFEARRTTVEGQIDILRQSINELREEIRGLQAQQEAQAEQITLLREEYESVKRLYEKGLDKKPRILALQRAMAKLKGEEGEYDASVARARQAIGEAELRIINVQNTFQHEVVAELREAQRDLAELRDKIRAQEDVLRRMAVAAPQAGVVVALRFHTRGGVIAPGDAILEIVPSEDKLSIEARVHSDDIDVVRPGLEAQVRLSAFRRRTTPTVAGVVTRVSADRFEDERTGMPFYLARVEVDSDELSALEDVKLYPGMPAEVMVTTGERLALDYLLSPITDSIHRAFREQ
jgi:HlyD family type I secretion membrane fusion protein